MSATLLRFDLTPDAWHTLACTSPPIITMIITVATSSPDPAPGQPPAPAGPPLELRWLVKPAVGTLLVAALGLAAFMYHRVDEMPAWMALLLQRFIGAELRSHQGRGIEDVSASKVLAYKVDQWFSTSASSKVGRLVAMAIARPGAPWHGTAKRAGRAACAEWCVLHV